MTYLLDTNVISELRKPRPHGAVLSWRQSVPLHQLAIPAIVLAEMQFGIELTRAQNRAKAQEIEQWLDEVAAFYNILSAGAEIYREWARLMVGTSADLSADAMIAATARVQHLIVVTRNVRDFKPFDVEVYNPFTYKGRN